MTKTRVYIGTVNNGVHTYYGPTTHHCLTQRRGLTTHLALTGEYTSDEVIRLVDERLPLENIRFATFVKQDWLYPHLYRFVSGSLEQLDGWRQGVELVVPTDLPNYVPLSNGSPKEWEKDLPFLVSGFEVTQLFALGAHQHEYFSA